MNSLSAQHLKLLRNEQAVLDNINLMLKPGELTALIGPNGAGKSTLLQALAGLIQADSGEVRVGEQPLAELAGEQRGRMLGYLAQQGEIHWPISVERLVMLGRTPHLSSWQQPAEQDLKVVQQAMMATDTTALADRAATSLSGGEKARALLARVLAGAPQILLADEPIAALDPAHQLAVMGILQSYAREQKTALVVMHDLSLAARYCDRILLMDKGELVADGPPSDVLTAERLNQVYGVETLILEHPQAGLTVLPWQRQ